MYTLDDTTALFLAHLHRGGAYAFWWTAPDKRSHWWQIGDPAPIPNGNRNVYFGVNPVTTIPESNSRGVHIGEVDPDTGRIVTKEGLRSQIPYIAAINCLYAEFDYKDFPSPVAARDHVDDLIPSPSVVINSGGGLHCYWLLIQPYTLDTEERRERAQHAQADFVLRVGGDPGAKDLPRVLRLPGTHNYKPKYAPSYPEVSYVKCDLDLGYTLDDLIARRKPKTVQAFRTTVDTDDATKAQAALDRLSVGRREQYQDWINVGLALYSLGEEGLRLWEAWSSGSQKYRSGECERKWRTFKKITSISIGSLFHWADSDDPGGKVEHKHRAAEYRRADAPAPRPVHPLAPDYGTPEESADAPAPEHITRREHGLYAYKEIYRSCGVPVSVDVGRQQIRDAIIAYLADPDPGYMLLIAAPAGIGKTTIAIETAEQASMLKHMRVLFAGPRREFWNDILQELRKSTERHPAFWYEWQPRTLGQGQGVGMTCRYADRIKLWQERGYQSRDFCSNPHICGWSYMNDGCAYHAQSKRTEPIIFVQHEHIALAHPLMKQAGLVIGDEWPLRAFLNPWEIPLKQIVPAKMRDEESALASILRSLRDMAIYPPDKEDGPYWHGAALMTGLGGAERVARICEASSLDLGAVALAPELYAPEHVEDVPFFHLPSLIALLRRESAEALAGREYISRVLVGSEGLMLLLRRTPTQLPAHVIWLDATGDAALYERLFNRPVRLVKPNVEMQGKVYQVYASRNNKHALENEEAKRDHIKAQIDIITARYERPAVITFKGLVPELAGDMSASHFGGNRGTNQMQGCDALAVVGTPQPSITDILRMAAILFHERMTPFRTEWSTRVLPFEGTDKGHTVSGFWDDTDLQLLLSQLREAELIQAINRARPLIQPVDIWLLSNIAIPGMPVELVSLRDPELFNAPKGVDLYIWSKIKAWAVDHEAMHGYVTTVDLVQRFGISKPAASKYIDLIAEDQDWPIVKATGRGRGKGSNPKAAGRQNTAY
jgi:hypothetical protein